MKLSSRQLSVIVVVKLVAGEPSEAATARAADATLVPSPVPAQPTPGTAFRIASKAFTESVILGEVVALTVSAAGVEVEHRVALGGSRLCWDALVSGRIDAYPEYTGTVLQEILHVQDAADVASLRAALRPLAVGLGVAFGFDNTYALGMRRARAAAAGIQTISELRRHPELRFGFSDEFMSRRDGWPGLVARYGLAAKDVRGLDHDLAYRGLAEDRIDVTDLYATDAEIRRDDLSVLRDDLGFFPKYEAILLYRLDAEEQWPAALAALRTLEGKINIAAMCAMNARAKLDHLPERQVAADFVAQLDGRAPRATAQRESWTSAVPERTREHLVLVSLSLLAAILVALPLGILAARRPGLGKLVLSAVGVVQTIPSLALLVFMIPLLGIGAPPAMMALFLYSLLPIVRNTHAGLVGIAPAMRDSAAALGLSRWAILWRVELPLALGTILAGIKSAAVINVGTATLGALVGAGGFGQPIFTGIRLDDFPLILQGAVPACLLALAVQGAFDLAERVLVPPPLRSGRRCGARRRARRAD
jgi:osmoprotectant transport system permease protein